MLLCLPLAGACGPGAGGTACSPAVKPPAGLVTRGALTWGSDMSYPPQEFNPGNPQGFDIDLARSIAREMCLQPRFVNQGIAGIVPALNARRFDAVISAMTITDAGRQFVDFVPYFSAGEGVVARRSSGLEITDLTQLCGLTVAVEDGSTEQAEITSTVDPGCPAGRQVGLKVVPADSDALVLLLKGMVQAHLTDQPVAYYDVRRGGPDLRVVSPILEAAPEGIAVGKNQAALLTAVQAAFAKLEANGTYSSLLRRWGLSQDDIRTRGVTQLP